MSPQQPKSIENRSFDLGSIESPNSIIKASPERTLKSNLNKKKSIKAKDWVKLFRKTDPPTSDDPSRFHGAGVNFKGKLIGECEVAETRGDEIFVEAMRMVKSNAMSSREHKKRIILNVSVKGFRINYDKTGTVYEEFPVSKISCVTHDMTDARAFSFVVFSDQKYKFYAIKTTKTADHVILSISDMFQVAFEMKKQQLEEAELKQLEQDVIQGTIDPLCETSVWIDESTTVPGRRTKSVLGIYIDLKQKMSEEELSEIFPLGCTNIQMENFDPAMFLLKNHGFTMAAELKQGLKNLGEDIASSEVAMRNMDMADLNPLLSVVNALSTLHSEIEHEEKNDNWPLTKPLASKIEEIKRMTSRLYLCGSRGAE